MRKLLILVALVALFAIPAPTATAAGCSPQYQSCLVWCTGPGSVIWGSYSACALECQYAYCDY